MQIAVLCSVLPLKVSPNGVTKKTKWVRLETAQEIIKTELNSVTELYNFAREQLSATIDDLEKKLAKQSASLDEQKKQLRKLLDEFPKYIKYDTDWEDWKDNTLFWFERLKREVFGENASAPTDSSQEEE